jgi:RluA family pseudouridine synthase
MEILFEDEFLLAVHKPAGLPSQQTPDPKRAHVVSELQKQFPGQRFFLHHRLDKDTSGVLLLSKHPKANPGLTEIFRNHLAQKTYLCLCLKGVKSQSPPEGQWPLTVINHLAPVRGQGQKLMRMVIVKKGGSRAETDLQCLEVFSEMDLFECKPKTGRTHQIRVHMASLYRPIAGDSLYGGKSTLVPRLMLHAKTLQFIHPVTQAPVVIEASLPSDFLGVLNSMRSKVTLTK